MVTWFKQNSNVKRDPFILVFIFFCLCSTAQVPKTLKVLFLGNSYTYVNDLPELIKNVAIANADTLVFDSNCPGGHTLYNHFNNSTSISKINSQQWDYVVIQCQSQEPSISPAQVAAQTLPYAMKLDSAIAHNYSCTTTIFFETWGRKNGDASNCGSYPPVCTYIGMQDRLKQSYKLFADTCKAVMAPVGEAWRRSIALNPSLELYQTDQSHPSLEGSYLAACVFYETMFQKSVLSNTYNPGITSPTLSFLQQTAHSVVNDSLLVWNIGKYNPCSIVGSITHSENNKRRFFVFPNPLSDVLNISGYKFQEKERVTFTISDMFGKVQKKGLLSGTAITISDLPSGIYFIELAGKEAFYHAGFQKK